MVEELVNLKNNSRSPDGADGNLGGGILDLFAQGYFERQGDINRSPGIVLSGITATGGVVNEYTEVEVTFTDHILLHPQVSLI